MSAEAAHHLVVGGGPGDAEDSTVEVNVVGFSEVLVYFGFEVGGDFEDSGGGG